MGARDRRILQQAFFCVWNGAGKLLLSGVYAAQYAAGQQQLESAAHREEFVGAVANGASGCCVESKDAEPTADFGFEVRDLPFLRGSQRAD